MLATHSTDHPKISSSDFEKMQHLLALPTYKHLFEAKNLQSKLDQAEIIDTDKVPKTLVTINTKVALIDERTKAHFSLTLVYPGQQHASNAISVLSVIGSALLGLTVGETIIVDMQHDLHMHLRIVGVEALPPSRSH